MVGSLLQTDVPGPGTAALLLASVCVTTAGFGTRGDWKTFLYVAGAAVVVGLVIEGLHIKFGDDDDAEPVEAVEHRIVFLSPSADPAGE